MAFRTIIFLFIVLSQLYADQKPSMAMLAKERTDDKDYVVLLHGLGRTKKSMQKLESSLLSYDFRVININYPSTECPIETLAVLVGNEIRKRCPERTRKIHFVTHSLGGIVLRYFLKENQMVNLGRIVMLSPPNQGTELVDALKGNFLFRGVTGPSGQQLGTEASSVPNTLGPVDYDVGIIAGDRSLNPLFSCLIPGSDDGKVSVDRSKLNGMADFITVSHSHTFIMNSHVVIQQIAHFLKNGRFFRQVD